MGVAGLWELIRPAAEVRSLTELAVTEGFIANPNGRRGFRIGIDASIWFFHAAYGREGENPELRTLFFRCCRLLQTPLLPLFVFDGPKRPAIKRGKRVGGNAHWLTTGMKNIIQAFGFEWRTAPGEAEAELAYLNRIGVIDAVLSDDADNFLFGATMVIRNPSSTLSGNRSHPVTNSEGRDDGNHVLTYRASSISEHVQITRSGAILIALLSGGDYIPAGLPGCGKGFASGLARAGLGESLVEAVNSLKGERLEHFLTEWRNQIRAELRTNKSGFLPSKKPSLAASLPDSFPSLPVLLSYISPITSETERPRHRPPPISWQDDPDPAQISALCELYFEWGVKDVIIKRFRTVLWPGVVCRALRRRVINTDGVDEPDRESDSKNRSTSQSIASADHALSQVHMPSSAKGSTDQVPSLPSIPYSLASFPLVASASRPSSRSSSRTDESNKDNNSPLLVDVLSVREHPSTDRTAEFRVLINPAALVDRATSGVRGIRPPLDIPLASDDEGAAENGDHELEGDGEATNDEEGPGRLETAAQAKTKKKAKATRSAPVSPTASLRLWMPAVMVRAAAPELVHGYEVRVQERALKNSKKGTKGTARRKVGSKTQVTAMGAGDDGAVTTNKPKCTTRRGRGPWKAKKKVVTQDKGYEYIDLGATSTCSEDEPDTGPPVPAKVKGKAKENPSMYKAVKTGPTKGKPTVKDFFSTTKPSMVATKKSKLPSSSFGNFTSLPAAPIRPLDVLRSRVTTTSKAPPNPHPIRYEEEEESSSSCPSPVKTATQRPPVSIQSFVRKPPAYVDVSSDEIEISEVRQSTSVAGNVQASVTDVFTASKVGEAPAKSDPKLPQPSSPWEESSHSEQDMGMIHTLVHCPPTQHHPAPVKWSNMGSSKDCGDTSVIHISSGSEDEVDETAGGIADVAMILSGPPVLSDPEPEPPRTTSKFKPAPASTAWSKMEIDSVVGLTKSLKDPPENRGQGVVVKIVDSTSACGTRALPLLVARAKAATNKPTSTVTAPNSAPKARNKLPIPEDDIIDLT
ncbi:hypothetical protein J3A83DRAFT_4215477 [Scleroderma citrinum]